MTIEIIDKQSLTKGMLYSIKASDKILKILYLFHAIERIREVEFMKIKYSADADILLIELRDGTPVDSVDLKEGVILHLDGDGLPLEIEILDASKLAMLKEISVLTPIEAAR
ncbi:MAG: DUF2283 domain-containing protein [Thermodesulfovibrionales bacterium]|jgi:uncharacterized protein YuzE|nr:DUF2283 domain-containing protein [Thermodesulfovibrionales bacterium]